MDDSRKWLDGRADGKTGCKVAGTDNERFPSKNENLSMSFKPAPFILIGLSDPGGAISRKCPDHSVERRAVGQGHHFRYRKVVTTGR